MRRASRRFSDREAIAAIGQARGLIAVAARTLGVSRQALYKRVEKSENLQTALQEAREFTTDIAEAKLFEAIQAREAWAVCFYLKCQGKGRGYVERVNVSQEVQHSGTVEIVNLQQARTALERRLSEMGDRLRVVPALPFGDNGDGTSGNGDGSAH